MLGCSILLRGSPTPGTRMKAFGLRRFPFVNRSGLGWCSLAGERRPTSGVLASQTKMLFCGRHKCSKKELYYSRNSLRHIAAARKG